MDIYEATRKWIGTFQKISTEMVEDLTNNGMDMEELTIPGNDTDVVLYPRDNGLPSWETMWVVSTEFDKKWMEERGTLQAISECGFRVYWSNKLGYFLGIDGGGYSFMGKHWIPLYKARGLQWHDENVPDPFAA